MARSPATTLLPWPVLYDPDTWADLQRHDPVRFTKNCSAGAHWSATRSRHLLPRGRILLGIASGLMNRSCQRAPSNWDMTSFRTSSATLCRSTCQPSLDTHSTRIWSVPPEEHRDRRERPESTLPRSLRCALVWTRWQQTTAVRAASVQQGYASVAAGPRADSESLALKSLTPCW